jgi:hypothetical protein
VSKLEQAKQKYPSIQLLQELVPALGNREGGAQSIQLKANPKDVYSENLYVGMMRELRDIPELNSLYNDIINVAILQGVGQTAISIRNIIPVEDYAAKIKPIIDNLQPNISLKSFSNGMFQRNNFSNKEIFLEFNPNIIAPKPDEKTGVYDERNFRLNTNTGEDELVYFIPSFGEMRGVTKTSRRLLVLNDMFNSFQLSSDYIKIPKVVTNKDGLKINISTGTEVTKADYAKMKQKGSQELYDAYYYKKVYTDNLDQFGNRIPLKTPGINKKTGEPLINKKTGEPLTNYYYKLINVYGDGARAVEYNTEFGPSVIDNGSMRIMKETSDKEISDFFAPQIQEEVVPLQREINNVPPVQLGNVKNFDKKNLFTVKPIQSVDKKATVKASIATQYIGFGEDISGSSTELYRQQAGQYANTGNYSSNDVIFVSVPGKRGNADIAKREQDKTIKETVKAVEAGATILTDNKAYINSSPYNTGEKRLYANMEAKGYNYSEITLDNQLIGTWTKSTEPIMQPTQPSTDINAPEGLPGIDRSNEQCS